MKDEIDDVQDRIQSFGQLFARRHFVRYLRIAYLRLGAHDALREGGHWREERAGDFFGLEIADFAECQRYLRFH